MGSAIWGIIGSLMGVVVGVWLTARWQRRQWIEDNKKGEYRQVLDALHDFEVRFLYDLVMQAGSSEVVDEKVRKQESKALFEASAMINSVLENRLFIRSALAKTGVAEDFGKLLKNVKENPRDRAHEAIDVIGGLQRRILGAAKKDLKF